MKSEVRILGIDDAPFERDKDKEVLVVGTVFRGASQLDCVMSTYVELDGSDSTDKIIRMIKSTSSSEQVRYIMIDGIAFAGFNVVDINKLNKETTLPVIVVTRNKPDQEGIRKALLKLKDGERKWEIIQDAGEVHVLNNVFFQFVGCPLDEAQEVIRLSTKNSFLPEPIRIAHIIASGVTRGCSYGRA
jgi:endonuclease V-like protein UPF0215 family